MTHIENVELRSLVKSHYTRLELDSIGDFLARNRTLEIRALSNGLFPAVSGDTTAAGRYSYVWLRDNIMVAHSRRELGDTNSARRAVATLRDFYLKHRHRFESIIARPANAQDRMLRPHVRFDGDTLSELDELWPHAQNDALGYLLWLMFSMANRGQYAIGESDCQLAVLLARYFSAIRYWQDSDNGHWEEAPKIECSSVGPVVAGLREMSSWLRSVGDGTLLRFDENVRVEWVNSLADLGQDLLDRFLPDESPGIRGADAALLFLIYPLGVVSSRQAGQVLDNVLSNLVGIHGIRRYQGDSYWCADYKRLFSAESRTADFSANMESRDRLLREGTEAQWALFDPIVSVIFGSGLGGCSQEDGLAFQVEYFNRALGQITSSSFSVDGVVCGGQCPEAYYVADSSKGVWVPNDHVPLLWVQANLGIALECMRRRCEKL